MKHRTIIAAGSNMGQRQEYINAALDAIGNRVGRILAVSDVIETKAWGLTDQPDFLNLVLQVETELTPRQLLGELQAIEAELDRVRLIHWGPRTIDLDIIFYDDWIIDEEDLHIPHIYVAQRRFVLEPLCQIAPDLIDPRSGKTAAVLLEELERREAAEENCEAGTEAPAGAGMDPDTQANPGDAAGTETEAPAGKDAGKEETIG